MCVDCILCVGGEFRLLQGGLVISNWPDRGKQMKQKIAEELKREQMNECKDAAGETK